MKIVAAILVVLQLGFLLFFLVFFGQAVLVDPWPLCAVAVIPTAVVTVVLIAFVSALVGMARGAG